jgi:hypothetical protein
MKHSVAASILTVSQTNSSVNASCELLTLAENWEKTRIALFLPLPNETHNVSKGGEDKKPRNMHVRQGMGQYARGL